MPDFDFQPYLDFVQRHYSETQGLYTPTDAVLPLKVQSVEKNDRTSGEQENDRKSSRKVEQLPVLDGLRKYALGDDREHVLLAGRPGSGKSMALRQLVVALASEGQVPVLIQLKGDRSVPESIKAEFHRARVRVTDDQINDWLFDDRLALLLDGVNEIPTEKLRQDLAQFREDNLSVPMVFTTRDLAIGGELGIGKRFEMKPLSPEQLREFVEKYLPGQGEQLLKQLRDRLLEIAETPLLLKMLCDVFRETGAVPQNKGELFRLFDRDYERIKKVVEYVPVSENFWLFKSQILQHLAFATIQADLEKPTEAWYSFPRDRAVAILEDWLRSRGITDSPTKAVLWIKDLVNYHLLQDAAELGKIEFHHQLFQEYYAAEALLVMFENHHPDVVEKERFQHFYLNYLKWTETIAIVLSLIANEEEAVRVVKQALDVDLMLGARLAGEVRFGFQERTVGLVNAKEAPDWLKVEMWGKTRSSLVISNLIKILRSSDIHIARKAAQYIDSPNKQEATNIILNRFEKVDTKFFSQSSFGGSDKTGDLWMDNVKTLAILSPKTAVQKLRNRFIDNGRHRNMLFMICTQAAPMLMHLDAQNIIPELISKLRTSQCEAEKLNYILNMIEGVNFNQEEIVELLSILENEKSEEIKLRILGVLRLAKSSLIEKTLFKLIIHSSYKVRKEVENQLIRRNIKETSRLEELLCCRIFKVSYSAAIVLGCLGHTSSLPILLRAIKSNSSELRVNAIKALRFIDSEESVEHLIDLLQDADLNIRRESAFSLSHLGKRESIPILLECLETGHSYSHIPSIRSLASLGFLEPLIDKVLNKKLYWQIAAIELVKLGKTEFTIHFCEILTDVTYLEGDASSELLTLLGKNSNIQIVDWLIDALKNPTSHSWDLYFPNRVALVLNRMPDKFAQESLLRLLKVRMSQDIPQLSWLIPYTQNQCKFYDYEIQQAKLGKADRESRGGGGGDLSPNVTNNYYIAGDQVRGDKIKGDKYVVDRASLEGGGGDRIATMAEQISTIAQRMKQMPEPSRTFHIQGNYIEKVEGGYHEHNYAPQANLKETEQLTQVLQKLRQQHPNATDAELFEILLNVFTTMPQQNPKNWQSWQNFFSVLFAGGVEGIKIWQPFAGIPIEVGKRLYDIYQKNQQQLPGN
jgi:energy-coupling factor transporter ATP-binding protein EcfA2